MVGYNSKMEMNIEDNRTPPTSVAQQQAQKIIKKPKKIKRKAGKINKKTKKRNDDDVIFVKQVSLHPRKRLVRKTRKQKDDHVIFLKQVPLHSRERLATETRKKKMTRSCLLNKYLCTPEKG